MHKEQVDGDRIFLIHRFLTTQECESFVARSEHAGYEDATITTPAGFVMAKNIRDNARLILDDASLAHDWWQRAKPFMPKSIEQWNVVGMNERFRFYRYDPGQRFAPHFDGSFVRDNGERSHVTFLVYLNSTFTGGETKFYGNDRTLRITVPPQQGMALAFMHLQLHEGAPVISGRKYVLRTDVMYAAHGGDR